MIALPPGRSRQRIGFTDLRLSDLSKLQTWLNRPHLRRFFQKEPVTLPHVLAEYGPAIRGEEPSHCHVAWHAGEPFGYLQCYRIAAWPGWAALIGSDEGTGVDLAIVEPHMIGRGFGRAMLSDYLRDVVFSLFPAENSCFIAHQLENTAAIACSRAVGFRYLRNFREDNFENALYALERDKSDAGRG